MEKPLQKKVLLVRDEKIIIEKIQEKIQERNLKTWPVFSAQEALYYLDNELEGEGVVVIFLSKNN